MPSAPNGGPKEREDFARAVQAARVRLEACWREDREPDDRLTSIIEELWVEASVALDGRSGGSRHYEEAGVLRDDLTLYLAARSARRLWQRLWFVLPSLQREISPWADKADYVLGFLQRAYGRVDYPRYPGLILTSLLGGRERGHPLLAQAFEALRQFGGPEEMRTPSQAVIEACGEPPTSIGAAGGGSREFLRRARELFERAQHDALLNQKLERALRDLPAEGRAYVEAMYAPGGGGRKDARLAGWGGPRRDRVKKLADAAFASFIDSEP